MRGLLALTGWTRLEPLVLRAYAGGNSKLKFRRISSMVWGAFVVYLAATNGLVQGACPDPPVTSCTINDACDNHLVKLCANGPQVGKDCVDNGDCGGYPCRESWREYFIDAGANLTCAAAGFGGAGADGVDVRDFDGDGDFDIVTGWEESGVTYIYRNPCDPSTPANPTNCTHPANVRQQWFLPWGLAPMDVRGGAGTESIEDAAFADFDLDEQPDGVVTATEGSNRHVKLHGKTSSGTWLGATLPGEKNSYMQVRAADINGDGCADIVAGSKTYLPDCYNPTPFGLPGCQPCDIANITCPDVAALWWWECPMVNGHCAPFGSKFGDTPPEISASGWTKRRIDDGFSWIMGIELTDMDGDGDKDVLYSDRQEIGWFENQTSPAQGGNLAGWGTPIRIDTMAGILARKDGTDFSSGEPFRFLAYGDVDGDGLKDVVATASFHKGFCSISNNVECATNADCPGGEVCNNAGDHFAGYFYRRLNAGGRSWQINPILVKGGLPNSLDAECDAVSKGVAIGDVTGEGRTDLVFSVRGAGHALYSLSYDPAPPGQCGPCVNHEWNARPISPCRSVSKYDNVQLADIDRDGLLDVVSAEENFPGLPGQSSGLGVLWYRNLGFCGNGRIDSDEECDNGAMNGAAGQCCDTSCRVMVQQICRASTSVCDAPEYCGAGGGACPADSKQPQGTPCAISQCDALPHECNGSGTCVLAPGGAQPCIIDQQCPSGLCLATDICAASCPDDGNPCTYDVCNGGICHHSPKPPGTACLDTDGNVCTVNLCTGAGTCQTVFHGTLTNCGELPTQPCDELDYCDGAGSCVPHIKPAGQVCRPSVWGQSQGYCDPPETCDGVHKECPPDLTAQVGAVCAPPPPRACNGDESTCYGYCEENQCDASHRCVQTGINPGTICYEDGNECSVHTCNATWCIRSIVQGPCADDGNECTTDVCQGLQCAHYGDPNAEPCNDDGNPCTDDICVSGECNHIAVPGRACDGDGNECTEDACGDDGHCYPPLPDETPCDDDGSVCTNDFCVAGVCEHPAVPTQIACESDDNECTSDVCITGTCEHVVLADQSCTDDDNECTFDVCDEAGLCSHPAVPDGQSCADDVNICTKDVCESGACEHPPKVVGIACGSPSTSECDAPDSCDGAGVCARNHVADQTACTADDLDCTIDECRLGLCVHAAELPLPTDKEVEPLCGGHALLPVEGSPNDAIRAFAIFDDGSGPALYAGGTMLHKWDGVSWTQIDTPIAGTIRALEVADLIDFGDGPALYVGGSLVEPLDGPQPLRRWDGKTWTDLGPFNGRIHALKAAGGVLYVGGAFTTVDFTLGNGTPVNGFVVNHIAKIAFLDPPMWEALGTGTNDTVYALAWGLYSSPPFDRLGVGGVFTTAGGLPASGFAYWNLNSISGDWVTVDPLLPPEGGGIPGVLAIAAFERNDSLRPFQIGGLFRVSDAGSPTGFSNNFARLLGDTNDWYGPEGEVTSGGDQAVRSIAPAVDQSGPATFVGGAFGSFNGVAAAQIVRLSGATHSLGSCLNGSVMAMIRFDDGTGEALYVGGLFTNSEQEYFVARWRALPGDIDGNGIVTEGDFTIQNESAQGMLICVTGPEPWQSATGLCGCSDLDGNGRVDMRDVAELMNLLGTTN